MKQITFFELTIILFYYSIAANIIGFLLQLLIVKANKESNKTFVNKLIMIVLTRIITLISAMILWVNFEVNITYLIGPISAPILILEIIFSIIVLKIFGYKIFTKIK